MIWIVGLTSIGGYAAWMGRAVGMEGLLAIAVFGGFGYWLDRQLAAAAAGNPRDKHIKLLYVPSHPPTGGKGTTQLALPKAA